MPLPQTEANYYHAQLGPQDKGRTIKGLSISLLALVRNYKENGSLDLRNVRGSGPLLWPGWLSSSSNATPH